MHQFYLNHHCYKPYYTSQSQERYSAFSQANASSLAVVLQQIYVVRQSSKSFIYRVGYK